jgi:hypothetical protein
VNGTFNGWAGTTNPLADPDGDKIWTGSISIPAGNHKFKYTVNGWAIQESFTGSEPCVISANGFNDRLLVVTGPMTYPLNCFNSCSVCPTTPPPLVNFSVDMANYTGNFTTVYVSGSFNNWSANAIPLTRVGTSTIWSGSANIPIGSHIFKYQLDGWAADENLNGAGSCTVSGGGFTNRTLNVTGAMTYPLTCYSKCTVCGPPDPLVTFSVNMSTFVGSFTNVYISGFMNNWSGDAFPLTRVGTSSVYTGSFRMPAGIYEYKVTTDNWGNQEQFAGVEECTKTTGPYTNRLFTVPATNLVIPTFCYNSCYACGQEALITFKVGMGNVTPNPAGVWLVGGGNFEAPGGRYKMSNALNSAVYQLTVPRQIGFSSFFAFANGNCPDYSCKENLTGLPCANPGNFNDRFLPAITGNTMYATCFGQCTDNTACTYPALVATTTSTVVTCFGGNNGTIALTMSGGSSIYQYNWGGGITTPNRTGLAAGTYTVTVTDSKSCHYNNSGNNQCNLFWCKQWCNSNESINCRIYLLLGRWHHRFLSSKSCAWHVCSYDNE